MKQNFTLAEAKCAYKHLTRTVPGVNLRGSVMAVDSYGGAVNAKGLAEVTSACQRSSIMKLQFQQYWDHPEEDAGRLQWMREFYTDLYSQHVERGTPALPIPTNTTKAATSTIQMATCSSSLLAAALLGRTRSLPISARGEAAL